MKSFRNNFLSKHLINYPSPWIFFVIPGIVMIFVFPFFLQNTLFQEVDASHCVQYYPQIITIGISCGNADLFDLYDQVASDAILGQQSKGTWVLKANIVVGNSATLNINSTYASKLKIDSTGDSPYHIAVLGNLNIDSVKVSACSNMSGSDDERDNESNPRPYITVLPGATGKLTISNSDLSCLGYNAPQREGVSIYGGSGNFANNTIRNNYYGLFAYVSNVTTINNIFTNNVYDINVIGNKTIKNNIGTNYSFIDTAKPFVAIRYPVENSTIASTHLRVEGTSFDEQSGIKKVEIFEHTFPFDNKFPYKLAKRQRNGSWLLWEFETKLTKSGVHRISVRATDNAGNENWAEVIFSVSPFINTNLENSSLTSNDKRIALVRPIFTDGAYNKGGFYEFYPKYGDVPEGKEIYTDLDLLSSHITYDPETSDATYLLLDHLKNITNGPIPIISDEDIHEGYIFKDDGTNAYDVLFMLHEEYVTKQEYVNLKQFVNHGGVIVFIDGNVLYAEVSYNPDMHTVTLLRGHDWKFNGKFAEKNVRERWLNENKDWMGSNFLWSSIDAPKVFTDNPFNYSHFEENYISNPDDHIIYDYHAVIPPELVEANSIMSKPQIASYSLEYGKGKVIMLGIYGQHLLTNPAFARFLGDLIFPQAAGSKFTLNGTNMTIFYHLSSGNLSGINIAGSNLTLNFERRLNMSDDLFLSIPVQFIQPNKMRGLENMTVPRRW